MKCTLIWPNESPLRHSDQKGEGHETWPGPPTPWGQLWSPANKQTTILPRAPAHTSSRPCPPPDPLRHPGVPRHLAGPGRSRDAGPRGYLLSSTGLRTRNGTCQSPLLPGPERRQARVDSHLPGLGVAACSRRPRGPRSRGGPDIAVPRARTQSGPAGARLT